MAQSRISDLAAGTPPIPSTALVEVSVVNGASPSGYDSRRFTAGQLLGTMPGSVTMPANLTIGPVASANPVSVTTNSGFNNLIKTSVNGGIDWYFGELASDSSYVVFDGTVSQTRLHIASNGECSNTNGTWSSVSSKELKEQIEPFERGLDTVCRLRPISFKYRAGTPFAPPDKPSEPILGLLAEEVEPVLPEIVGHARVGDREVMTLAVGHIVFALINAVRELSEQVEQLTAATTTINDPNG